MYIKSFENFNVYIEDESHSFVYADFDDKDKLIDGVTDYLFSEENLLNYTNNISKMSFSTTDPKYWAALYRNISYFLNSELEMYSVGEVDDDLLEIIKEEYKFVDEAGKLLVQKDKVGKIGEYAFHVLLNQFFKLSCIIPKIKCTTDRNMSVFGIDTLFLDVAEKCIYFGESKFSKNIDNGIILANKSLDDYEQQIKEEYRLVLSSQDAFILSEDFKEIFQDETQVCIKFESFIDMAKISTIGVPVFIAHGRNKDSEKPDDYILKMKKKLHRNSFFGLNVKYIFISLPVIDKTDFIKVAMEKVVNKYHEFDAKCK